MTNKSGFPRWPDAVAVVLMMVTLSVLTRAVIGAGGLDRDKMCVDNVYRFVAALKGYSQDYDEQLPPMPNYPVFTQRLAPYASDSPRNIFYCPATRYAGYTVNRSLLRTPLPGGTVDWGSVELLRDSRPHPDGKLTVGFLDGHVERGGVDQAEPNAECVDRVRTLSLALRMYAQDYDEQFPFSFEDAQLQDALVPYTHSHTYRVFQCPETRLGYDFNIALRGRSLASIAVPAHRVMLLRDAAAHSDGKRTVGFLDGHVERGGILQPPTSGGAPNDPETVCMSNARELALGIIMYVQDYDERLPPMTDYAEFHDVVFPYVKNDAVFLCPPSNLPFVLNTDLDHIGLAAIPDPADTIMFRAPRPGRSGLTVTAFADGHVKKVP